MRLPLYRAKGPRFKAYAGKEPYALILKRPEHHVLIGCYATPQRAENAREKFRLDMCNQEIWPASAFSILPSDRLDTEMDII